VEPGTFLAGIEACYARSDIDVARNMMQVALDDQSRSFQPPLGAYLILMEMLKYQNLSKEAIALVNSTLKVGYIRSHSLFLLLFRCL
jgi:hypothetical protein